jgi:hypothetical protein
MHRLLASTITSFALVSAHTTVLAQQVSPLPVLATTPAGWTRQSTENPQLIALVSLDKRVRITVYATRSDAIEAASLEQRAKLLNARLLEAHARAARSSGASIAEQSSSTTQVGNTWHAETITNWSDGLRLRGVTILQPGQQVSVGAESRVATQAELASAIKQIHSAAQR